MPQDAGSYLHTKLLRGLLARRRNRKRRKPSLVLCNHSFHLFGAIKNTEQCIHGIWSCIGPCKGGTIPVSGDVLLSIFSALFIQSGINVARPSLWKPCCTSLLYCLVIWLWSLCTILTHVTNQAGLIQILLLKHSMPTRIVD